MELQCPGCQKKLAIADQHAGQMIKCPSCGGMFMAPALPAMPTVAPAIPVAPPVPPASSSSGSDAPIPFAPAPPPPPPHPDIVPPPPPPPPPSEPEIELPPGDFSRTRIIQLCPDTVCWFAPVACVVLFFLSFGKWMGASNVWELVGGADTAFIFYMILTVLLGLPLSWVKLALEKGWIPKQDFLKPIWQWRSLIVAGVLGLGLLIIGVLWIGDNLRGPQVLPLTKVQIEKMAEGEIPSPTILGMTTAMKLAVRVQLFAVLGALAEYWLQRRRKQRLPYPEATIRW